MQRATVTVHLKHHKTWTFRVYGKSDKEVEDKIDTFKASYQYDSTDIEHVMIVSEMGRLNFNRDLRHYQEQFEKLSRRFGKRRDIVVKKPLDIAAVNRFLRID